MAALFLFLTCAAPSYDSFDAPLDSARWYVGTAGVPKRGALKLGRDGWIVARGLEPGGCESVTIRFRHKGGALVVSFHEAAEPLSSSRGPELVIERGPGDRLLQVTKSGASLDGKPVAWSGALSETFRIAARKGAVEINAVEVTPRAGDPKPLRGLDKRTVWRKTTPLRHRIEKRSFQRVSLTIWDCDVCFLLERGEPAFAVLRGKEKGAPALAALVTGGTARALTRTAGTHPLAQRDWADERGNMKPAAYQAYLRDEYAAFALIQQAQRALNASLPRQDLKPLVALAVIRHTPNTRAAIALAQTQKATKALKLLQKHLPKGTSLERGAPDAVRRAAGRAAAELLGELPPEWKGFNPQPMGIFTTIEQAKDLCK